PHVRAIGPVDGSAGLVDDRRAVTGLDVARLGPVVAGADVDRGDVAGAGCHADLGAVEALAGEGALVDDQHAGRAPRAGPVADVELPVVLEVDDVRGAGDVHGDGGDGERSAVHVDRAAAVEKQPAGDVEVACGRDV